MASYNRLIARRAEVEREMQDIDDRLAGMKNRSARYGELKKQQELASHELTLATDAIARSAGATARNRLEQITEELVQSEQVLREKQVEKDRCRQELKDLNNAQADWSTRKGEALRELGKRLSTAQAELDRARQAKSAHDSGFEMISVEMQELEKEITRIRAQIEEIDTEIAHSSEMSASKLEEVRTLTEEREKVGEELKALKESMSATNDSLAAAVKKEDSLQKKSNKQKLERKKLTQEIAQFQEDKVSVKRRLKQMKREHTWIAQEERFFGVQHTDFDFKLYDPKEARSTLDDLIQQRNDMEGHVNKKAVAQYDKAEAELDSLRTKRDTVENEKRKIKSVIEELERKKNEAIEKTHRKVDQDLSDIVSQVLPGSRASLVPLEGHTIYDGLEMTVYFTNVRKSLQELSGGQRSLIALALILALLKFKPAPVYILDEIDAALDLSHTQNIGRMLRNSFKSAQFIVVSLKEGMFNNANVVFRTSFRDSNSKVERTVNDM
jgi:structural maintenance of chromosome 2